MALSSKNTMTRDAMMFLPAKVVEGLLVIACSSLYTHIFVEGAVTGFNLTNTTVQLIYLILARLDGEFRDALCRRGISRGQRARPVFDRFDHLSRSVRARRGRLRHHGSCNGQYALLGRRADVLLVYRVSGAERRAHSARPRQGVDFLVADLGLAQARGRVRARRRQVELPFCVPGDLREHDRGRRSVRRRGLCARSADHCPPALVSPDRCSAVSSSMAFR